MPHPAPDSLHQLIGRLDARRDDLEQATMERIVAISDPAGAPDPAYYTGLRSALTSALDYGLAAIAAPEGDPVPVPVDLLAQARLAARNRVNLDAVLRRYSAGHTLLADGLLEEAAALGLGAAELQAALRALAARFDRIVAAVSEEYERESVALGGVGSRRYALLRRLLAGELLDTSSLDYPFGANHVAIVAAGNDAVAAIDRLGGHLDRRLLRIEPDAQLIWAWLGGRRAFSEGELDLITSYPWPEGCAVACGEPAQGLAGWRLSHRQALAALPVAQRGRERLVHYRETALLASALQDDLLLTFLHRRYLAPLEAQRDRGQVAKDTLRAYFAVSGNITSTAAAMGVTRRTVRGRLAMIETRLECPIDAVRSELDLILRLEELGLAPTS